MTEYWESSFVFRVGKATHTRMKPAARRLLRNIEGKSFLVTGGGGYVGNRIVLELLRNEASSIIVIDIRPAPDHAIPSDLRDLYKSRVKLVIVDLRQKDQIVPLLRGVDVVIHTASFGMSGRDMLMKEKVRAINVGGTQTLLEGCVAEGVVGFVYTSSANVVFSGRYDMPDLAEDLPYNREEDCVDEYSRTKCIAEQTVVNYNGTALKCRNGHLPEEKTLQTCAVRPAAIYGEGEERHFPRIISMLERGMLKFLIGSPDSKVDWVHVDNLVHGHVLAAAKLLSADASDRALVGGKAYYISDKKPMNNFLFMKPLIEGLGFNYPDRWIPFRVMFLFAHFLEIIHTILSPVFPFEPFANRAEVCKIGVTHYFRTDKAERELEWSVIVPPEEGIARMVAYFQKQKALKAQEPKPPKQKTAYFMYFLIFLAIVLGICLRYLYQ